MMSFLVGRCTHMFWRVCTNVFWFNVHNCWPASIKLSSSFFVVFFLWKKKKKFYVQFHDAIFDAAEMLFLSWHKSMRRKTNEGKKVTYNINLSFG